MSTPYKAATRWQHIGTATDVDADGQLTMTLHIAELESGEEFTCSVTGRGTVDGGYFIAALQAAAAVINGRIGMPDAAGVRTVLKANLN